MRKMNYWIGALALGLGVLAGTLGMSLASKSSPVTTFISKLRGQESIQTVSGPVSGTTADPLTQNDLTLTPGSSGDAGASASADANANAGANAVSGSGTGTGTDAGLSGEVDSTTAPNQAGGTDPAQTALNNQIIADYKQDIGTFFEAWKSVDIDTFRQKLAKAYTGDIFEKHARRAEEYINQGIGLEATEIDFDRIDVESADTNTATLRVDYRYTARDYNLTEGTPVGDGHEQSVHVRVNLIKMGTHWLITGESSITN